MFTQTSSKTTLQLDWSIWHDYTESEVQKYAPLEAGVYVLAVKLTDGNLRVFYVGQTDNLDRRLKEHLSKSESNECVRGNVSRYACMFRYATVARQVDRDRAERALYRKFVPSCNDGDAIPDVADVEINF
jgi:excinuclease UvrABC nuclease subunit